MTPAAKRGAKAAPDGLLLTHGAGSGSDHPTLLAIEAGVAPLPVTRIEFPYRREGRKPPDRAPKLITCVREEADAFAERLEVDPGRVLLGGRSMGGRMCSMAVAEGQPAAGLVLISYPLHPPGKPDRLRVDHFPLIEVPCLFVSGTRDPFGTPEEMEHHVAAIPAPVTMCWIEGGRHELKGADDEVVAAITGWLRTMWLP